MPSLVNSLASLYNCTTVHVDPSCFALSPFHSSQSTKARVLPARLSHNHLRPSTEELSPQFGKLKFYLNSGKSSTANTSRHPERGDCWRFRKSARRLTEERTAQTGRVRSTVAREQGNIATTRCWKLSESTRRCHASMCVVSVIERAKAQIQNINLAREQANLSIYVGTALCVVVSVEMRNGLICDDR